MWSTFVSGLTKFLAGYAALVVALYMLSYAVPKAAFFARVLAGYISLVFCALFGVVAGIVLRLAGVRGLDQYVAGRAYKYAMAATTGITFEVLDPNNVLGTVRPAVFVGNHQTELDVLMLGCMFPRYCSVTAKASLRNMPFLGWFMSLSGAIFIDRKSSKDARSAMQGAADQIRARRQSVYLFPEGTRSYAKEPVLLPFKKGAFHLAVQAGVPIVPCVVANYSHILWIKGLIFRSGKIPVKILEPIPTEGLTADDVEELTRTTREKMLKELVSLTALARGQPLAVPAAAAAEKTSAKTTGSDVKREL